MAGQPTARRYAQSAFEIALETDSLDAWSDDLKLIEAAVGDPDFAALLDAPQVPEPVKLQGINTVLADAQPVARNLLGLLVSRGQFRQIGRIRAMFERLADEHRGIARADVLTAVPLGREQSRRVADELSRLANKNVVMTEHVDESVLGGVVARVGDSLIDGSTRSRLLALRETLGRRAVPRRAGDESAASGSARP